MRGGRGGQDNVEVDAGAGEGATEGGALEFGLKGTLNLVGDERAQGCPEKEQHHRPRGGMNWAQRIRGEFCKAGRKTILNFRSSL